MKGHIRYICGKYICVLVCSEVLRKRRILHNVANNLGGFFAEIPHSEVRFVTKNSNTQLEWEVLLIGLVQASEVRRYFDV